MLHFIFVFIPVRKWHTAQSGAQNLVKRTWKVSWPEPRSGLKIPGMEEVFDARAFFPWLAQAILISLLTAERERMFADLGDCWNATMEMKSQFSHRCGWGEWTKLYLIMFCNNLLPFIFRMTVSIVNTTYNPSTRGSARSGQICSLPSLGAAFPKKLLGEIPLWRRGCARMDFTMEESLQQHTQPQCKTSYMFLLGSSTGLRFWTEFTPHI